MNILELSITDLKKVSAIEICPTTGKPVILTGDNANGKSSVLESIILGLSNKGLDDPIRHGRPSGSVKIVLGADKVEYTLERRITKKGDYLTLTDANGAPVQKAQTFLNGILGNYAFDPLEFTKLKAKDQVEALKAAAGLDFSELDAERAAAYAERTVVTREGKELAAQLAAIPAPDENAPKAEVSAVSLIEELTGLETKRRDARTYQMRITNKVTEIDALSNEYNNLVKRMAEIVKESDLAKEDLKRMRQEAEAITEPTDEEIAATKHAIANVETTNRAVRAAAKHAELDGKVKELRLKVASLNRKIEVVDERKAEAIKNANLPLAGLELTDDGVMFNGTFFSQLSTAEQIRISTLVAMSQNPELKIIIIREGALMNSANLALISELAAKRGFQLWIEKFQENPSDIGFHIVDGAIAFEDGAAVVPEEKAPETVIKPATKAAPAAAESDTVESSDF